MSDKPLEDLALALEFDEGVPFAWIVEHGQSADDPVERAWRASAAPRDVAYVATYAMTPEDSFRAVARALIGLFPGTRFARQARGVLRDAYADAAEMAIYVEWLEEDAVEQCAKGPLRSPLEDLWMAFAEAARGYLRRDPERYGYAAEHAARHASRDAALAALRRRLPAPTLAALTETRRVA